MVLKNTYSIDEKDKNCGNCAENSMYQFPDDCVVNCDKHGVITNAPLFCCKDFWWA